MSNNVFASLGAIISALQANNCKLVNFSEAGEIIFEMKQDGKIITAVLTKNNNSEESNFEVISENQSLIWKQNIEQQLNEAIKTNYNNTAEHSNYDAVAKRAIHAIGYDFNDEGQLFKADNRPWYKKLLENFNPKHPYFVTYCIMAINILVFLAMLVVTLGSSIIDPDSDDMIRWGASFTPLIIEGQYWRFFTNMFLHFGIMHIAFNMYALHSIGGHTEYFYKNKLYIAGYITCGLVASIVSLWFRGFSLGAGASGAIFGVIGMLVGYTFTDMLPKEERQALLKSLLITVGLNIALTISSSFIDNAAHIAGLICGIIISFFCRLAFKNNFNKNGLLLGFGGMVLILGAITYLFLPKPINDYKAFSKIEKSFEESKNELANHESSLDEFTEHYETKTLLTLDSAIESYKNLKLPNGYIRPKKYFIKKMEVYKKLQYFNIKYCNDTSDLKLKDSLKLYDSIYVNGLFFN